MAEPPHSIDMLMAYASATAQGYPAPARRAEASEPPPATEDAYARAIRTWSERKQAFDEAYQVFGESIAELRRAEDHMHALAVELDYAAAAGGRPPPPHHSEPGPEQPPVTNGTMVVPVVTAGHFGADPPPSADGLNAAAVVRAQLEALQRNGNVNG